MLRRAERERAGAFLVEGPNAVAEALVAGWVRELYVNDDEGPHAGLVERARAAGVEVVMVSRPVIDALAGTTTPQGIVAVAEQRRVSIESLAKPSLVTVLADVRDPGNAGTLMRTSLAAGADAVVVAKGSVDPYNPKTVRASAGALFRVPVVGAEATGEALEALRSEGLQLVGADAGSAVTPDQVDLAQPTALVLGNEAWGIPPDDAARLDVVVGIPMPGPAESLNVGIAGSILLFEAVGQRRERER